MPQTMKRSDNFNQLISVMSSVEHLSDDCLDSVFTLARVKEYAQHSYFAREGDHPMDLAFVCQGTFRAFYRTEAGEEYNKTFFTENTFMLALTAMITGQENVINIQALENSTVLLFDYQKFTGLYDSYPKLERLARKVVEFEWAKKEIREIRLVMNDAAERYEFFRQEHPGLENKIPHYHIASYLGISPIHLSRIRAKITK